VGSTITSQHSGVGSTITSQHSGGVGSTITSQHSGVVSTITSQPSLVVWVLLSHLSALWWCWFYYHICQHSGVSSTITSQHSGVGSRLLLRWCIVIQTVLATACMPPLSDTPIHSAGCKRLALRLIWWRHLVNEPICMWLYRPTVWLVAYVQWYSCYSDRQIVIQWFYQLGLVPITNCWIAGPFGKISNRAYLRCFISFLLVFATKCQNKAKGQVNLWEI